MFLLQRLYQVQEDLLLISVLAFLSLLAPLPHLMKTRRKMTIFSSF